MSVAIDLKNPFPGLRPFEPEQADLFFGRDEQIEELLNRLEQKRFLAVVGTSGSGKSSLVRAGLIPAVQRGYLAGAGRRWRIAVFRPGSGPLAELNRALAGIFAAAKPDEIPAILQRSSLGLAEFARQHLGQDESLLLVIDQFEELFRYRKQSRQGGESQEAAAFVKLLLAATGHSELALPQWNDLPVYVVLTMRSDFLGMCSQFRGLPEALNDSQYLVPRLTREQQRESIEGPIDMAGGRIAPQLVQRLLNDVGDNPDQLPVLQHALMRAWEQAGETLQRGGAIEVADYKAIGEMEQALNDDANQVLAILGGDPASEALARRMFQRLVEPGAEDGETRRPTPLSEIVAVTGAAESEVRRVIAAFQGRGFLILSEDSDPVVDISHESLIRLWDKLKGWVKEEVESAKIYSQLATSAKEGRSLYREPELTEALRWKANESPNAAWARRYPPRDPSAFAGALAFLKSSRRWQRFRVWSLIAAVILVAGLAVLAFVLKRKSDEQRRVAITQKLAANAEALGKGPGRLNQLSLLLATEALRRYSWVESDRAIRQALARSPVFVAQMKHEGEVTALQFSADGKFLWSGSADKTVRAWETGSGKEVAQLTNPDRIGDIRLSPDGRFVAVASYVSAEGSPGLLRVWEWDGARAGRILIDWSFPQSVLTMAFDPTSSRLLASDFIVLRSLSLTGSSQVQEIALNDVQDVRFSNEVQDARFSEDGDLFASAHLDGSIQIRDGKTLRVIRTIKLEDYNSANEFIHLNSLNQHMLCATSRWSQHFWNPISGKQVAPQFHSGDFSVALTSKGELAVVLDPSVGFTVWETATAKPLWSGETEPLSVETDWSKLALSLDDTRLVISNNDLVVRVYDMPTQRELFRVSLNTQARAIALSLDGQYLAIGEEDGTLTIWRLENDSGAQGDFASSRPIVPVGKFALVEEASQIRVLDWVDHHQIIVIPGEHLLSRKYSCSSDNRYFAITDEAGRIRIYDLIQGQELPSISPGDRVTELAFSSPAMRLVVATRTGTITKWDPQSGTQTEKFEIGPVNREYANSATLSRDARIYAVPVGNSEFHLWDVEKGVSLGQIPGMVLYKIQLSADGQLAVIRTSSETAVWTTQSPPRKLWQSATEWSVVTLSPDGRKWVTTEGQNIQVWDAANGQLQHTLNREADPVAVAVAPDSQHIAAGYVDGITQVWRLQDGDAIAQVARAYKPKVKGLEFSSDGRLLIIKDSSPRDYLTSKEATTVFRTVYWHPEDLINEACRRVSRNLTPEEWKKYLPDEPYRKTCPQLP